jgi:hypothetical protein
MKADPLRNMVVGSPYMANIIAVPTKIVDILRISRREFWT